MSNLPIPRSALTDPAVRQAIDSLVATINSLTARIAALEGSTTAQPKSNIDYTSLMARFGNLESRAFATITPAELETKLTQGVTTIAAGVGSDYRLVVDVTNGAVGFKHKDTVWPTLTCGAYSGTIRTGMLLTSNGIAMGYHRKSDGNWVNSVAIDGATGDASFSGTVTASSFISASATVDGGYGTIGSIASTASSAYSGLSSKLTNGAANVMSTGFYLKTSGYDSGSGVAMYDGGFIAKHGGTNTFVLDGTTGNATFYGTVDCGNGAVVMCPALASPGSNMELIKLQTSSGAQWGKLTQEAYNFTPNSNSALAGWQYNFSVSGGVAGAFIGACNTYGTAQWSRFGVVDGGYVGVGTSSNGTSWTWYVVPRCDGVAQTNLNADLLDGNHASAFQSAGSYVTCSGHTTSIGGTSSGSATATFSGTTKPGSNTTNGWLSVVVDGTQFWIPAWN